MPKPKTSKRTTKRAPKPPRQSAAKALRLIAGELSGVEAKPLRAGVVKATDYAVVLPAISRSLSVDIGEAANIYEKYKGIIELVLGSLGATGEKIRALLPLLMTLLGSLDSGKKEPKPEPAPVPEPKPTPQPTPEPGPVTPPAGVVQGYASLGAAIQFFSHDKGKIYGRAQYDAKISGNGGAQMVGDKAHFNITPRDTAGREIGPGDPRHLGWDENGYPHMRYRWWIDGVQQNDADDHFNLSSIFSKTQDTEHHYDNGCTPTLKLIKTWGSGKGKAEFEAYMPAEFNGPYGEVTSNRVTWYVD